MSIFSRSWEVLFMAVEQMPVRSNRRSMKRSELVGSSTAPLYSLARGLSIKKYVNNPSPDYPGNQSIAACRRPVAGNAFRAPRFPQQPAEGRQVDDRAEPQWQVRIDQRLVPEEVHEEP